MATIKFFLSNRALLTLGFSETVSGIGNWITMMAVFAMVVFRGQGGVAQSSGIFIAGLLPNLLFSPAAGWLIDRYDRRRLMIASELVSGVIVAGLIFTDHLALIYALLALQAVSLSLITPARNAVVPELVGPDALTQANAFLQQLSGIIKIVAPFLAGAALSVLTPQQAIVLNVVTFALSALILSRLPSLKPFAAAQPKSQPAAPGAAQPAPGLLAFLRQNAQLRLVFVVMSVAIFVLIGFDVLLPVYIRDVLHGDEKVYGVMIGLVGAGMLVGTLGLLIRRSGVRPWRDVMLGLLLLAIIPGVLGFAGRVQAGRVLLWGVYAGCLLGGVGNGLLTVQISTLLQMLTAPALRGRVAGVFQSVTISGQMSGLLLTPLVVPFLLSIELYFGFSALVLIALCAAAFFALRDSKIKGIALADGGDHAK